MRSGFTLLELSIVLIVIGLIIGGVTAGQSMIRSAKLNRVIADATSYMGAIQAFRLQYGYLPGDMPNASTYWPTCHATPSLCDDNGDGQMASTRSWLHLSLAEMVPGSYSYASGSPVIGQTVPKSAVDNAGFWLGWYGASIYGNPAQNILFLGSGASLVSGSVPSTEAAAIDAKMDDGLAAYGRVLGVNHNTGSWQSSGCVSGGTFAAAASAISWDLTNDSTPNCLVVFTGF